MPRQMCIGNKIPHSILAVNAVLKQRGTHLRGRQGSTCIVNSKYVNHNQRMTDWDSYLHQIQNKLPAAAFGLVSVSGPTKRDISPRHVVTFPLDVTS